MLGTNGQVAKHTAPPATGKEIRLAVGVTGRDEAVVQKVMSKLGYFHAKNGRKPVLKIARKRKAK